MQCNVMYLCMYMYISVCVCQTIFHVGVSCVFWFILILSHFVAIKNTFGQHLQVTFQAILMPEFRRDPLEWGRDTMAELVTSASFSEYE